MALEKTEITYNFGIGGLDTKTDPKFAPLGRPIELANVRFPKTGQIAKRYGLAPAAATQAHVIQRMLAVGDELLMVGKTSAGVRSWYSRFAATDKNEASAGIHQIGTGISPDPVPPVPRAWVENVYAGVSGNDLYAVDAAVGLSQTCYVYRRSSGNGDRVCIVDNATGHLLYEDVFTAAGSQTRTVRVLAVPNSNTFIVGTGGAGDANITIGMLAANATTGAVSSLGTDTSLTLNANGAWDWALFGNVLIIARRTAAATTVTVSKFTVTATALGSPSSGSAVAMVTGPDKIAIAVPCSSTEDAVILAHEVTNGLRGFTVSTASLAVVQSLWVINATLTVRNQITGCRLASGDLYTLSELNNASTHLIGVSSTTGAIAATPSAVAVNGSAYLGSKPIVTSASTSPYFLLIHRNSSTDLAAGHGVFLMEGATVVGRFLWGDARLPPTANSVAFVPQISAMAADGDIFGSPIVEYFVPALRVSEIIVNASGGSAFQSINSTISALRFNVHPSKGYNAVQDDGGLLVTGGFLACYDGTTVVENGFLHPPEILSVTPSNGSGGLPVNGNYSLVACFVHVDAKGRVHRSAPSLVRTATTGASDDTLTVVVRALQFSQRGNYTIEVYCTEDDGTVLHMSTSTSSTVAPATTTVSLTVQHASDAALITCSPLGQQGAILENDQPSCPILITSNGRRVHCVSGADRLSVLEGKERVQGEGAAFFPGLKRRITRDGEISVLESIGERWVAMKKRRFFIASGEGADDAGQIDSLSEFEAHPTVGVGCANPRAAVSTPFGLIFRSEKGYYLLDAGGGITPIGTGVDDYKDFPVISSVFHADRNEVHFLLLDGPRLVLSIHETEAGPNFRWSTDEDNDNADAYCDLAVVGGLMFAAPDNRNSSDNYEIFVEEIGGYADQGSAFPVVMRFTTGWIPIGGKQQGRGRFYGAKWLGDALGVHIARVRAAYDYKEEWIDDKSITSANATAGGESPYQWEFRPTRQKVRAVKLQFIETLESASRGALLNQLVLICGVQPGTSSLKRQQRATAT